MKMKTMKMKIMSEALLVAFAAVPAMAQNATSQNTTTDSAVPLAAQEINGAQPNSAPAPPAESADLITVRDGTPVTTKLTEQLSSATAKVGDDVELTVAQTVRQDDGLIIIPKDSVLSARVASVHHARRSSRNGSVTFAVDKVVFPGGETAALREAPKVSAARKFGQTAKIAAWVTVDPELAGMGLPLLAVFGPVLLVERGHEKVYYKGSTTTLYINGPVYLQREAVLKIQPPPYEGPAQVFYANRGGMEAVRHSEFYCGEIFLADVPVNGTFRLELDPGAYWFSAGQSREKVRLEVQADHQYYVERESQGLTIKDFHANQGWFENRRRPADKDFTASPPEIAAELTAERSTAIIAPGRH